MIVFTLFLIVVTYSGGIFMIVKPQKELLLEEMVSRISSENLHEEIDSGESVGNEAWQVKS